ncbi:hypothetical protein [Hymenobacter latericus]|uniref:hypothetical protein n=1 Tax=Hymenobacter sp. YIM 151858-1 TaxID=2987688 RepID=UPI00222653BA|nr:hypothetical protein [Hymenobacter sp. YIM 151858-1]UYZ58611.1 hypothetical protein OIS50_16305 [Hymenobacter sp. YIM 151858-1]
MNWAILRGILIAGLIVLYAWLMISQTMSSNEHVKQVKSQLGQLNMASVQSILLAPLQGYQSLVQDTVIIRDTAAIEAFINRYKSMGRCRSCRGNLPGNWQVKLIFQMKNGATIPSTVHHSDDMNIVFIPTKEKQAAGGYEDYFVDSPQNDLDSLIVNYK